MEPMTARVAAKQRIDLGEALLDAANPAPLDVLPPAAGGRQAIHGAIVPAEVRPGDPIAARARRRAAGGERDSELQVWRISPLGVELVRPPGLGDLRPGARVDLTLRLGDDLLRFPGLAIASSWEERGRTLVAARWCDAEGPGGDRSRRRDGARWRCGEDYLPTGMAANTVRFADWVHFRVADISRTGMRLLTSLRNKFLVPGFAFEGTCTFPTLGEVQLALRVVHARVVQQAGKELLSLGVTWSASGTRSAQTIGQYLLQFGPGATPAQLRSDGFRLRSTSRAFDFGWVHGDEEYRKVLELRRLAYVHAKKVSDDTKDEDMGDAYDARSRIIVARYRGRLVGTLRVMFPATDGDRLKHEDFCTLPATMPPRTEIVEASKACTHPDFRGSDLFYSTLQHASLVTMQARRRYIFMSCQDSLLPIYLKLGFEKLPVSYVHPTMKLRHHVLLGDVAAMAAGRMNPIMWNVAVGPELWTFANLCGVVPRDPWRNARVRLLRLFKPLAFLVRLQANRARAREGAR